MYRPDGGHIIFDGHDMTGRKPHRLCHRGMARTYQIVRYFPQMTVLENVLVGSIFGASLHRADATKKAQEMLDFVEFPFAPDTPVSTLNTMQLKRLELARALSTNCKMLLLDEVAAGLTPGELNDITRLMFQMRDNMGITIVIVEHLMKLIMNISDRIAVLHFGEKLIEATPEEVVANESVQRAYLGANYPGASAKKNEGGA
jgi:branched-chain amino acid transport system ATP-binding protein